jgi:phage shock protein PspC (stress-responsive transcriptional regulator)
MTGKLYRSQENKILGGVCGGLGEYLGIDPTLVRIFFVIFALASGSGVLIYLLLWIIIPGTGETAGEEFSARTRQMGKEIGEALRNPNPSALRWIGVGLIAAGLIFLLQNLNVPWLRWLNQDILWPILLILGGIALLMRAVKGE